MHPAGHFILGVAAFAVVRRRGFAPALLFAGASILADIDHLAWHAARTGHISPRSAWTYFAGDGQNEEKTEGLLFHRWSVIGGIALAGLSLPPARWLAGGLALHALVDMADALVGPWWRGRAVRRRTRLHETVFARAGYRCEGCGAGHVRLHAHHRIQREDGGSDTLDNFIALCGPCHIAAHELLAK